MSIFGGGAASNRDVALILSNLQALQSQVVIMANNLDALTASVAKNTTVIGSAITLIQGFSAQLKAAGTDPVALAALQKQLDDNDSALAAAVAANIANPAPPGGPPVS